MPGSSADFAAIVQVECLYIFDFERALAKSFV
jgi:hypothetical protein